MINTMVLAMLSMSPTAMPAADPLEPAHSRQLQCYEPNEERKTCRSLASYKRLSDNRYTNTALVLISAAGPATLETETPVEVKSGAVCGAIRRDDILKGKLVVGGRALPPNEASPILAQIAQSMASVEGKEICTRYVPAAAGSTAKVSIDGAYQATMDQRVKWVKLSDGYSVSP